MVAVGWRKIGDDGENLCRVLDDVLNGVDALKTAVRRGQRLYGEGEDEEIDWEEIWCPELCRSSTTTSMELDNAKAALRRMKDTKKMLESILRSLDDTIQSITDSIALECRAAGLASLPDDVLAPILELCHARDRTYPWNHYPDTAGIFASVCKRFRRIAIHLPSLWRDVSPATPPGRLSIHAARSPKLRVYLDSTYLEHDIVQQIHPACDWEELHLRYQNARAGVQLLQVSAPPAQTSFDALERLFIIDEHTSLYTDVAMVSEERIKVNEHLVAWRFPNVTGIRFRNVLPQAPMHCPTVTSADFTFQAGLRIEIWNSEAFREFLQCMPKLVSLAIGFECYSTRSNAPSNENVPIGSSPVVLSCLQSLRVNLIGHPPLYFISHLIDMVETERLTRLHVFVGLDQRSHESRLTAFRQARDEFSLGWIPALFSYPYDEVHPTRVRSFPAVEEFSLDVNSASDVIPPPFYLMFRALPNVKHLSINLPGSVDLDLCDWAQEGGLRELRTLRISECTPWNDAKYSEYFERLSTAKDEESTDGRWEKFERLEVVSSSITSFQNETFEEFVGDKLVWLGPKGV